MPERAKLVVLFDVDNTLLDNDRVTADLRKHLEAEIGPDRAKCYWDIFEQLRSELGYADYLGALQRCRLQYPHDARMLTVSHFLIDYPFADRLLPGALAAVERARSFGTPAILSDGDVVFQPLKVRRSGLFQAFAGRVLIYVHKEAELADVAERYPADHYVMVDDKLRLLDAIKKVWGAQVTTVFVRQGHYAVDPKILSSYPAADVTLGSIGEFVSFDCARLLKKG
jgi:FMN phosphatase YigB (HAD superfamily)